MTTLLRTMAAAMLVACGGGSASGGGGGNGDGVRTADGTSVSAEAHQAWEDAVALFQRLDGQGWNEARCSEAHEAFDGANDAQGGRFTEAIYMMGLIAERCRNADQAREYIESRFTKSYRDNGFGMFMVELKENGAPLGICGMVSRDTLPDPDIGFAFLPRYWSQGYAREAAEAALVHAKDVLRIDRVLAITTQDNESSGRLLERIGLKFDRLIIQGEEELKLFSADL